LENINRQKRFEDEGLFKDSNAFMERPLTMFAKAKILEELDGELNDELYDLFKKQGATPKDLEQFNEFLKMEYILKCKMQNPMTIFNERGEVVMKSIDRFGEGFRALLLKYSPNQPKTVEEFEKDIENSGKMVEDPYTDITIVHACVLANLDKDFLTKIQDLQQTNKIRTVTDAENYQKVAFELMKSDALKMMAVFVNFHPSEKDDVERIKRILLQALDKIQTMNFDNIVEYHQNNHSKNIDANENSNPSKVLMVVWIGFLVINAILSIFSYGTPFGDSGPKEALERLSNQTKPIIEAMQKVYQNVKDGETFFILTDDGQAIQDNRNTSLLIEQEKLDINKAFFVTQEQTLETLIQNAKGLTSTDKYNSLISHFERLENIFTQLKTRNSLLTTPNEIIDKYIDSCKELKAMTVKSNQADVAEFKKKLKKNRKYWTILKNIFGNNFQYKKLTINNRLIDPFYSMNPRLTAISANDPRAGMMFDPNKFYQILIEKTDELIDTRDKIQLDGTLQARANELSGWKEYYPERKEKQAKTSGGNQVAVVSDKEKREFDVLFGQEELQRTIDNDNSLTPESFEKLVSDEQKKYPDYKLQPVLDENAFKVSFLEKNSENRVDTSDVETGLGIYVRGFNAIERIFTDVSSDFYKMENVQNTSADNQKYFKFIVYATNAIVNAVDEKYPITLKDSNEFVAQKEKLRKDYAATLIPEKFEDAAKYVTEIENLGMSSPFYDKMKSLKTLDDFYALGDTWTKDYIKYLVTVVEKNQAYGRDLQQTRRALKLQTEIVEIKEPKSPKENLPQSVTALLENLKTDEENFKSKIEVEADISYLTRVARYMENLFSPSSYGGDEYEVEKNTRNVRSIFVPAFEQKKSYGYTKNSFTDTALKTLQKTGIPILKQNRDKPQKETVVKEPEFDSEKEEFLSQTAKGDAASSIWAKFLSKIVFAAGTGFTAFYTYTSLIAKLESIWAFDQTLGYGELWMIFASIFFVSQKLTFYLDRARQFQLLAKIGERKTRDVGGWKNKFSILVDGLLSAALTPFDLMNKATGSLYLKPVHCLISNVALWSTIIKTVTMGISAGEYSTATIYPINPVLLTPLVSYSTATMIPFILGFAAVSIFSGMAFSYKESKFIQDVGKMVASTIIDPRYLEAKTVVIGNEDQFIMKEDVPVWYFTFPNQSIIDTLYSKNKNITEGQREQLKKAVRTGDYSDLDDILDQNADLFSFLLTAVALPAFFLFIDVYSGTVTNFIEKYKKLSKVDLEVFKLQNETFVIPKMQTPIPETYSYVVDKIYDAELANKLDVLRKVSGDPFFKGYDNGIAEKVDLRVKMFSNIQGSISKGYRDALGYFDIFTSDYSAKKTINKITQNCIEYFVDPTKSMKYFSPYAWYDNALLMVSGSTRQTVIDIPKLAYLGAKK
jgi:hypothetical protein